MRAADGRSYAAARGVGRALRHSMYRKAGEQACSRRSPELALRSEGDGAAVDLVES